MERLEDYEETGNRCNVCSFEISEVDYRMYGRRCVLHAREPNALGIRHMLKFGFLNVLIHNGLFGIRRKIDQTSIWIDEGSTRMNLILSWSGCYNITDANTAWKKLRVLWNIAKVGLR